MPASCPNYDLQGPLGPGLAHPGPVLGSVSDGQAGPGLVETRWQMWVGVDVPTAPSPQTQIPDLGVGEGWLVTVVSGGDTLLWNPAGW